MRPSSSALKVIKRILRRGLSAGASFVISTIRRAVSRSPTVPDALSSAPLWIAKVPGAREPAPPIPTWSKWAPTTTYSWAKSPWPGKRPKTFIEGIFRRVTSDCPLADQPVISNDCGWSFSSMAASSSARDFPASLSQASAIERLTKKVGILSPSGLLPAPETGKSAPGLSFSDAASLIRIKAAAPCLAALDSLLVKKAYWLGWVPEKGPVSVAGLGCLRITRTALPWTSSPS